MIYLCGFIVIYLLHIIEGGFVHSPIEMPHDEAVDFCKSYGHHHRLVDDNTNHTSLSIYMKNVNLTHAWMGFKRQKLQDWTWLDGTIGSDALAGLDTLGRVCGGIAVVDRSRRPMRWNYGGDHEGYICQNKGTARCNESEPCFVDENTTYTFDCGVNDFYTARMLCARMGMTLAKMDTEKKVKRFAEKKSEFSQFALCSFFWIGLRMEDWETENKVINYSHWQEGQPEYQGNCTVGQVISDKVMWETVNCNKKRVAVCQSSTLPTVPDSDGSSDFIVNLIIPVLTTTVVLAVLLVCGIFCWCKNKMRKRDIEYCQEIQADEIRDVSVAGLIPSSQEASGNNPTSTESQTTPVEADSTGTIPAERDPLMNIDCNADHQMRSTIHPGHRHMDHPDVYGEEAKKEERAESTEKYTSIENYLNRIEDNLDTKIIDLHVLSSTQTKHAYEEELEKEFYYRFPMEVIRRILHIDQSCFKRALLQFIWGTWKTFDNSASDSREHFLEKVKEIKKKIPELLVILDFPKEEGIFDSDAWEDLAQSCTIHAADQPTSSMQSKCQPNISFRILSDFRKKKKEFASMYAPVDPISGSSGIVSTEPGPWLAALVSAILLMYAGNKDGERYQRLRSTKIMHAVLTDLCDQTKKGKKKELLLNPWDILSNKDECTELINKHTHSTLKSTTI